MSLVKHEIENNDLGDGVFEKRSISFDIEVCDYYGLNENNKDKKIIKISINVINEVEENGNVISWGRKSAHHVLDFELKDKEDIYGVACALSCILDNGLSKALCNTTISIEAT